TCALPISRLPRDDADPRVLTARVVSGDNREAEAHDGSGEPRRKARARDRDPVAPAVRHDPVARGRMARGPARHAGTGRRWECRSAPGAELRRRGASGPWKQPAAPWRSQVARRIMER